MNYSDYDVIALFRNKNGISERVFADIVLKGHEEKTVEAYIIMINPGSCEEDKKKGKPNFEFYQEEVSYAKIDPAQRCVIRLMSACGINKIRILNLSNERQPKMDLLLKNVRLNLDEVLTNSFFSNEEKSVEDRRKYMSCKAPCILAWGKEPKLNALKKQAYDCIISAGFETISAGCDNDIYSYSYIKPWSYNMQEKVIAELTEKWNAR